MLINSLIERGIRYEITGFLGSLPANIAPDDKEAMAEYVVSHYERPNGFSFHSHDTYMISKRAKGLPVRFVDAEVYRFHCSQRMRTIKPSTLPNGQTRNRCCRVKLVACRGSIHVLFPSPTRSPNFEIAIEVNHSHHEGREQFGVPSRE